MGFGSRRQSNSIGGIQVSGRFIWQQFHNRVEEAIGNRLDVQIALGEGAFKPSLAPWIGYMMLLQECDASTRALSVKEPHFKVFKEWQDASYAKRYELFCQRLVRERLYAAACFLLSDEKSGLEGQYREPSDELSFKNFAISLTAHAAAYAKLN